MSEFNTQIWQGRGDAEEGAGPWRWHQVMRPWVPAEGGAVVLLGFNCDEGVRRNLGRIGAAAGPDALRSALANLPLHGVSKLRDAGNVGGGAADSQPGASLEASQAQFAVRVSDIIRGGSLPIGLGGGHEIAWASWCGLHAAVQGPDTPRRVGIVNFDAHFDLRAGAQATSGTPFRQIADACAQHRYDFNYFCLGVSRYANTRALFERAGALGVHYLLDEQLTPEALPEAREKLANFMRPLDDIYLTICLDALPAHLAPGVSAPAARGIGLDVLEPLLDLVLASGRVRVADIAELNPRLDIDHRTARLGARLVARIAAAR